MASKILAEEQLEIEVDLGLGGGFEARYYTCDFSYDYVRYIPFSWIPLSLVSMEVIERDCGAKFQCDSNKSRDKISIEVIKIIFECLCLAYLASTPLGILSNLTTF